MILLVSGATKTVARHPELGVLVSPRCGNSIERIGTSGRLWGADNDAFLAWDTERYWAMLGKISKADRSRLLFVVAPDRVGDARATLNLWHEWWPQLEYLGLPAAFVAQNGIEGRRSEIPWEDMRCLFVGGDDAFKLGETAESLVREAKARGKWVHMGRVNTAKRLRHAIEIGCDSADGRSWSAWPDTNIPKGLRWIRHAKARPSLF